MGPHSIQIPIPQGFREIEILVRLTDRSSGILGKHGCVVTIRVSDGDSHHGTRHWEDWMVIRKLARDPDHKLPFWVKR